MGYANKFVPVPGKDAFFLYKRSQSTDAGPERRCRYLQDRLSARILNVRIFQILTSRPDTEVSRRLPSSFLAPALSLFDRERLSMRERGIFLGEIGAELVILNDIKKTSMKVNSKLLGAMPCICLICP